MSLNLFYVHNLMIQIEMKSTIFLEKYLITFYYSSLKIFFLLRVYEFNGNFVILLLATWKKWEKQNEKERARER